MLSLNKITTFNSIYKQKQYILPTRQIIVTKQNKQIYQKYVTRKKTRLSNKFTRVKTASFDYDEISKALKTITRTSLGFVKSKTITRVK